MRKGILGLDIYWARCPETKGMEALGYLLADRRAIRDEPEGATQSAGHRPIGSLCANSIRGCDVMKQLG